MKRVLSLCDHTGIMVRPWVEAGHEAVIVDLQHPAGYRRLSSGLITVGTDIASFHPLGAFEVVFAFPPCTHLCATGARWWKEKGPGALREALGLVQHCLRIFQEAGASVWMLENPIGRLSTEWRRYDYAFDPCDYGGYLTPPGDGYNKRTCLWTSPAFVMPPPKKVVALNSRSHLTDGHRRDIRNATPRGFAQAVYEANR